MKINDLLHDLGRRGLEVHLSWSGCVKNKGNKPAFCRFATERLSVNNTRCVNASWVTLGNGILNGKHVKYKVKEEKSRDNGDHGTQGGDVISTSERVWVVRDTAGHSGKTQEVHREKGKVYTDEESSEMNFT